MAKERQELGFAPRLPEAVAALVRTSWHLPGAHRIPDETAAVVVVRIEHWSRRIPPRLTAVSRPVRDWGPEGPHSSLLEMPDPEVSAPTAGTRRRRIPAHLVRAAGILVALLALALCGLALVDQWGSVKVAIEHADYRLLGVAFLVAALGMSGLGVLWWRCLRIFGERAAILDSIAWYFAGELGKYLPGGIWPVLGRGELARRRGGISRSTGYATTLISYAAMVAAAAVTCGLAAPVLAIDHHVPGWEWLLVGLIPLAVVGAHPAVFSRLLGAAKRVTKGRVNLETPSWSKMLGLIVISVPTWVLVGISYDFVARSLGFDQSPVRIAFAAVAAWIIGFLAVPVPAGVGIRELIFVALCGLPAGPAAAVAAAARLIFVGVDGVGGTVGLCVPAMRARIDRKQSGRETITESGVASAKR